MNRLNLKHFGIVFAIAGAVATIVYTLESIVTQDVYSYQWLISVVLILFVCAYLFIHHSQTHESRPLVVDVILGTR